MLTPDSHFEPKELLLISHISKCWRDLTVADKRWKTWFQMIVNPENKECAHDALQRFHALDTIPARCLVHCQRCMASESDICAIPSTLVNLCFDTNMKCTICSLTTNMLFLPLLKRICLDCLGLHPETHAVMCLSSALTSYDLSEKDVRGVVVLSWEETDPAQRKKMGVLTRAKLVSTLLVRNIAIAKHGGEAQLATHLQYKKDRLRKAYEKRVAAYEAAAKERVPKRKARGGGDAPADDDCNSKSEDDDGGIVGSKNDSGKKAPKTRPKLPAILRKPFTPLFYQSVAVLPTNFIVFDDAETGVASTQRLVECKACVVMANVRWRDGGSKGKPDFPDFILEGALRPHEQTAHEARRGERCVSGCSGRAGDDDDDSDYEEDMWFPRCEVCLNAEALATKDHLEPFGDWYP